MTNATPSQTWEEIIVQAILDGQNQIHDIRSNKATAEEIEKRMHESFQFHKQKMQSIIQGKRKQACQEMIEYIEKQVPEYNPEIDNAPGYMDAIAWAEEFLKKMP